MENHNTKSESESVAVSSRALQTNSFSSALSAFPANLLEFIEVFGVFPFVYTDWIRRLSTYNMFGGKTFDPEKDIPDLSGKVIIITGGNAGLGKESVLQLVKHNPKHVYLAARAQSKAEAAISDIRGAVPEVPISHLPLDLTSFESIRNAANQFKSSSDRLDILMNNAGVMATPYSTTREGYEIQFGTNHVGHHLFTKLLLPTLQKTAEQPGSDVRIVNVSSEGHRMAPSGGIVWDQKELETYNTWRRYGQSKTANILFTMELAKRYPNIKSVSIHPGVILTDLYGSLSSNPLIKMGIGVAKLPPVSWAFRDVPSGTLNQLWAATGKGAKSGAYYTPIGTGGQGKTAAAKDEKLATELWDWTESELSKHGF